MDTWACQKHRRKIKNKKTSPTNDETHLSWNTKGRHQGSGHRSIEVTLSHYLVAFHDLDSEKLPPINTAPWLLRLKYKCSFIA